MIVGTVIGWRRDVRRWWRHVAVFWRHADAAAITPPTCCFTHVYEAVALYAREQTVIWLGYKYDTTTTRARMSVLRFSYDCRVNSLPEALHRRNFLTLEAWNHFTSTASFSAPRCLATAPAADSTWQNAARYKCTYAWIMYMYVG